MSRLFIYHKKQPDFTGNRPYPLNLLKSENPELYARQVKKYEGCEWLLDIAVPPLDCLWNDVLHFSLMHPNTVYRALLDAGFTYQNIESSWFEVPLEDVLRRPAILYLNYRILSDTRQLLHSDFEPVTAARAAELSVMPERNLEYYRDCFKSQTQPLLWKRAPHFFLKDHLDVADYKVFDWREPLQRW